MPRPSTLKGWVGQLSARGLTCTHPGCARPRYGYGRLCRQHYQRQVNTGDAAGINISTHELRPFFKEALAFIEKEREHLTTAAALAWLRQLLEHPINPPRIVPASSALDRTVACLHRLQRACVTPEDALATVIAVFLMWRDRPQRFPSERFFKHQLSVRFLRLAKGKPPKPHYNAAAGYSQARISVTVRDYLGEALIRAIGRHALAAVRAIQRRRSLPKIRKTNKR